MRSKLRRIMDHGAGYGWLEPVARLLFVGVLVVALLFAALNLR